MGMTPFPKRPPLYGVDTMLFIRILTLEEIEIPLPSS
jgi:hypothetical protein